MKKQTNKETKKPVKKRAKKSAEVPADVAAIETTAAADTAQVEQGAESSSQ